MSISKPVTVAAKLIREDASIDDQILFIKEAHRMTKVQHPHIVRILAVCTDSVPFFILLEYLPLGDLKAYLKRVSLPFYKQRLFAIQVCSALEYLGQCRLVHRDVAARNVLVESDALVKLSDFGLARGTYVSDVSVLYLPFAKFTRFTSFAVLPQVRLRIDAH